MLGDNVDKQGLDEIEKIYLMESELKKDKAYRSEIINKEIMALNKEIEHLERISKISDKDYREVLIRKKEYQMKEGNY